MNQTKHTSPDKVNKAKPIPFRPKSKPDELALEIASALDDVSHLPMYRYLCEKYGQRRIREVLRRVQAVPEEKIKKSRAALFVYLIRRNAHEED